MKILIFGAFMIATAFGSPREIELKLPNKAGSVTLSVTRTNKQGPDELLGMQDCGDKILRRHGATLEAHRNDENLLGCLLFKHPQFVADTESRVPVVYIETFSSEKTVESLKKLYSPESMEFGKASNRSFAWGVVHEWATSTTGSAHYLFLAPKNKSFAIRIGPIAGLTLAQYDFGFEKAKWSLK